MNPTLKRYLLSSATTFITSAAAMLAVQLSAGTIVWTTAFWVSLTLTVIRAGVKSVVEGLAAQHADDPATL